MESINKLIRHWFEEYTQDYAEGSDRKNIILKIEHSRRVAADIVEIGKALQLSDEDLKLAEIAGILHDTGRFEQYRRYGTFSDVHSVDHAKSGVSILKQEKVLEELPEDQQELILKAIQFHNYLNLPENESERVLFFSRLLRDADKLDIFKMLTEYFAVRDQERNETLELDLPEKGEISEYVYEAVLNKKQVDYRKIKNLNDFKLLQAGWVYGLNFVPSLRLFKERGFLARIKSALPDDKRLGKIYDMIDSYLDQKLADGTGSS